MSSDLRERRRQQPPPAIHTSGNGTTNGSGIGSGGGPSPSAYSGYYGTTAASPHSSASSGMDHHSPQNSASNIGYRHNAGSAGSNGSNGSNANGSAAATGSSSRQYMYQAKKAGGYDGYPRSSSAANLLSVGVGHGNLSGDETKNRRRFSFGGKRTTFSSLQIITIVLSIATLVFFASTLHYRSKYSTSTRHVDDHVTSKADLEAKLRGREKYVKFLEERMVKMENDRKRLKEETAEAKRDKVGMERRMQDAMRRAGQVGANRGKAGEEGGKSKASATDAGLEADAVGKKTEEEHHIERHAPEIEADEEHHPHWDGLSAYSRMAAAVLGYDRTKWDDGAYVHPIFERTLEELTDEERSASSLLWLDDYFKPRDGERRHLDLPSEVAGEIEKDPFHHPYWDELSEYSRAAATVIGYDQHSWDSEDYVHLPIFERTLDELGDEEREASKFLWLDEFFKPKEGTGKESLSTNEEDEPKAAPEIGLNAAIKAAKKAAEEEEHTEHPPEIEADEKHHPYWDGLSAYSRMAAAVLGYDKDSWDNNIPLPIFDHALDELSDEERSAATLLWLDDYFLPQEEEDKV